MQLRLYARDPVLHALVPRLVGLARDKRELVAREHRDGPPAVLLTGRHGMGRTAVLDALEEAYRGRLPLGRADAGDAETDPEHWTGFVASNTSAVVELLVRLVCDLAPGSAAAAALRFPRLLPALFAVSGWHRGSEQEQAVARDRVGRLLAAHEPVRGQETESRGTQWVAAVSRALADVEPQQDQPDLEPVADAVVHQYFTQHVRGRAARAVQQWHLARAEGAADGNAALARLCLRFHQGGAFRNSVERTLMAAFLEDLGDAYGTWQRVNRTPVPLVLLDNAHTEAGGHFLDLLLDHRAGTGAAGDPLVVVATGLHDSRAAYPDASHSELPELVERSGWRRTVPGSPSAGLLLIPLAPLGVDELLLMLDQAADRPAPLHPHLPRAVHALTRGHPAAGRLLCEAATRHAGDRPAAPADPAQLLDLPTEDGRAVAEVLLEQLIPQPQFRARLTLLALARDRAAAQALAEQQAVPHADLLPAATAARYLEEESWTRDLPDGEAPGPSAAAASASASTEEARFFVPDPFLRDLLVHEARRGCEAAPPGGRWHDLHTLLREHHEARAAAARGPEADAHRADALRHLLAVGEEDEVVIRLAGHFTDGEAARWLGILRHVATAPRPPHGTWTDERVETARGTHDRRLAEADDVRRSVNRLLHALWYLAETYAEPTAELADGIRSELVFLSMRHSSGHAALNRAAQTWSAAARHRQPYPVDEPH